MSTSDASNIGDKNLREQLDPSQLNCLNETEEHTLKGVLGRKSSELVEGVYLESDADEQLLLNIHFNQRVKLRSLIIQTSPSHLAQAPKTLKLFINRPSIGFEDVEDAGEGEAAQIIELSEADVKEGRKVTLRYVRFQSVDSLHIFVQNNQGDEETTRIDSIEFFGSLNEGTKDLSGLNTQEEE